QFFLAGNECFDLFYVSAILRNVRQGLSSCLPGMWPGSCMGPVYGSHVTVGVAVRSVLGLGSNLATTDDLASASFGVHDVADGDIVLKLPAAEYVVVSGDAAPVSLQRFPEGFAVGVVR